MTDLLHPRYGDLDGIAASTDHRCHLCAEPVDLVFYGRPGSYGDHTVTVDHLEPQAFGGSDDQDNLRLAHASCNSSRGVRPVEDVRWELTGSESEPWSADAWALLAVAAGGAGAVGGYRWAGVAFANEGLDGARYFNRSAATLGAALAALLAVAAIDWLRS